MEAELVRSRHPQGTTAPGNRHAPLSIELHTGTEKPGRRPWAEPQLANHLYFATPSEGAEKITVEAVDRSGKTYTESVEMKKA